MADKNKQESPPRGLQPVDQPESLKTIAYRSLHRALISGDLQPGSIYKEKDLAGMLNISRTPVREALLELSAKGLVSFLPRKGIQITQFELRDLNESFELRKALELMAIEKAALKITQKDLDEINATVEKQKESAKAGDQLAFLHYDRTFHALLTEITDNRRLVSSLEAIRDVIQLMGAHALAAPGRFDEVITEHEGVVKALSEKAPEEARQKMAFHLEMSRKKARSILFPEGEGLEAF